MRYKVTIADIDEFCEATSLEETAVEAKECAKFYDGIFEVTFEGKVDKWFVAYFDDVYQVSFINDIEYFRFFSDAIDYIKNCRKILDI